MNEKQKQAIERFRSFIERHFTSPQYGEKITEFEAKVHDFGLVTVSATTDLVGLPENNTLRLLSRYRWMAFIGERGRITVRMAPDSFKQFNNRYAFGILFKFNN